MQVVCAVHARKTGAVQLIAFVTSEEWPDLTEDDRLAVREMERLGRRVVPAVWSGAVDWLEFDLIVLRSCWDYHRRSAEFREWVQMLRDMGAPLVNSAPTVFWNLDKRYLLDLAAAGVAVIDTVLPAPGTDLIDLMEERGWVRAVLKPAVSADGDGTLLIERQEAAGRQADLDALTDGAGALLQEFIPAIREAGELSFVFVSGAFSHCVRKLPASGDFRVQPRFGGSVEPWRPDDAVRRQAAAVLAATPCEWIYARVDGCLVDGRFRLMELELIEPSLFLSLEPSAPARFAEVLVRHAEGRRG
jgi:glutathione synthase/RimK-type ligase-like ATP-grasp enzyme